MAVRVDARAGTQRGLARLAPTTRGADLHGTSDAWVLHRTQSVSSLLLKTRLTRCGGACRADASRVVVQAPRTQVPDFVALHAKAVEPRTTTSAELRRAATEEERLKVNEEHRG